MSTTTQATGPIPAPSGDDEIDLRQLVGSLIRQWRLIASVSGACLLISGIYAFTRKPVWQGSFQIVLASSNSPSSGSQQLQQSNPGLASLIGVSGGGNALGTEVKILESPSVLKPVFDFVKNQKAKTGIDVRDWRYLGWLGNLTIELEQGTSVLNIEYRDSDKEMILPVIDRISKAYQAYSGRDRERGITQAITYLDQQIEIYSKKSI